MQERVITPLFIIQLWELTRCITHNRRITVQMDDDMVKHYSNEDTCLLEVHQVDEHTHDITLVEYDPN